MCTSVLVILLAKKVKLFPTYGQWVFDSLIVIFKEYFRGPDGKSFSKLSSKYSITFLSFSSQRLTYKDKEKIRKLVSVLLILKTTLVLLTNFYRVLLINFQCSIKLVLMTNFGAYQYKLVHLTNYH